MALPRVACCLPPPASRLLPAACRRTVLRLQFLVIYEELIINFVLALAAVAVLSSLVLGQLVIVLLVCLTVVSLCPLSRISWRRTDDSHQAVKQLCI